MSQLGHGRLGLVSALRPFSEFIEESAGTKIVLAEMRGGRTVADWSAYSADTYVAAFGYSFGGVLRDVVGVRTGTDTGPGLTRVDSIALCDSTAGSYFYDPAPTITVSGTWDDGGVWDVAGDVWDDVVVLYVHLEDGSNPNSTTVLAELGFFVSNVGIVHPTLSEDRLLVGGFESWTDVNTPNDWSVTESTWEVKQETTDYREGSSALRLEGSGSGSASVYKNGIALLAGAIYRLCGEYKIQGTGTAATIEVSAAGGATSTVQSDGRTYATSSPVSLSDTGDEWRRFSFDFIAVGSSRLRLGASGTSGSVRFDKVELKRVWRYTPYEARLASSSVPASSTGSNDIFFGGKRIGTGSLSLINSDGKMEKVFGQLDWSGREVLIHFGGIFRDGSEILADDYRRTFTGLIQGIGATDDAIQLSLQDARVLFNVTLPPRVYSDVDYPTMDFTKVGKARPLWFGVKTNIDPVRISTGTAVGPASATGYGVYEVADTALAPNGLYAITDVHFYENKEAADAQDVTKVISNVVHSGEYANFRPDLDPDPTFSASTNTTNAGRLNTQKTAGANNAWNAGARLSAIITGGNNLYIEGTVGAGSGTRGAIGLATSTADYNPNTTKWAIEWTNVGSGAYHIWINGVDTVTVSGRTPQACDRLRVHLNDLNDVTFWCNGQLMYTDAVNVAVAATTYYARAMFYVSNTLVGYLMCYRDTNLRYSYDLAAGTITVTYDAGPYRIIEGLNGFTFSHTGTNELTAYIPPGLYAGGALAGLAGGAMAAAAAADTTHTPTTHSAVYSQSTHLITFTLGTSAILEVQSGTGKGVYPVLGFTGSNRATATSHVSDKALFDDPDKDHFLRVFGTGFKDDASGTYTGTPSGPIEAGSDILRVLASLYMPPVSVDDTSFTFARGRAPEALGIYLNAPTSTKEILDTLEYSNIANIVLDGEGRLFYLVYVGDVPDGITDFYDRDYLDFDVDSGVTDVYTSVKVLFDKDPTSGEFTARSATDAATSLRFGRPDGREFKTYLTVDDNAIAYSVRMLSLASTPSRRIKFSAKGKLVDKKVGDKIRLTRARAFDPAGKLSARVVRIISMTHDYQGGKSSADCVDDVVTVAGYQCVSVCQSTCEATCQTGCEFACQATCEDVCQDSCQVSCEGACQGGVCQAACQLACQGACESSCQVGCQTGCQTACETACQSSCELHCQFTCQVACQQTCELACQTTCETSCQTACELSCQTACESSCQTACQVDCQTYKQQEGFGGP